MRLAGAHSYLFWALLTLSLALNACSGDVHSFYSSIRRSDVFTQQYNVSKYDFLWVMDNSASMADRRQAIRDNMQTFVTTMTKRKAIDYQMAITLTDGYLNGDGVNHGGALVSASGTSVVKSTSANPIGDFASLVNSIADTNSSFWEQGLEAALQAVTKNGTTFMRPGVPLVVIFLTDENDYSCKNGCTTSWCSGPTNCEPPELHYDAWTEYSVDRYVSYFNAIRQGSTSEILVFPIVGATGQCVGMVRGQRYLDFQSGMGTGIVGSICPDDLLASYNAIAQTISDRATRFELTKTPAASGMTVYVDGKVVQASEDNGYMYDKAKNAIFFSGDAIPNNGAKIEVSYNIAG